MTAARFEAKMIAEAAARSRGATAREWFLAAKRNARMSENTVTRSQVGMTVLLVLHAVCGAIILWLLLKLVPQYLKLFKDFDAKLPDMTIVVIDLSALFGRYWFVLVPGLAAGDIAIMLSLNRTGRNRLMTAWGVIVWLAAMLLIGLIMLAVMVPLNDLIVNLSRGK